MLMLSLEGPALFSVHTSCPVSPGLYLFFFKLQTIKQVVANINN